VKYLNDTGMSHSRRTLACAWLFLTATRFAGFPALFQVEEQEGNVLVEIFVFLGRERIAVAEGLSQEEALPAEFL
jgi:hypothetical protein